MHKDVNFKYKAKYRSLMFNLKDEKNRGLFRKVLLREIDPARLVTMSADELASKELAEWREREEKKELEAIEKHELDMLALGNKFLIKTHKGEQIIEEDDDLHLMEDKNKPTVSASAEELLPPPVDQEPLVEDAALNDTTERHDHALHVYDPGCRICTGREPLDAARPKLDRDREREKNRDKDRDKDKSRGKDRDKDKEGGKSGDRDKDKSRGSDSDKERRRHHSDRDRKVSEDTDSGRDSERSRHKKHHSSHDSRDQERRGRHASDAAEEEEKDRETKEEESVRTATEDDWGWIRPRQGALFHRHYQYRHDPTRDLCLCALRTPPRAPAEEPEPAEPSPPPPPKAPPKPRSVWRGFISMPDICKFFTQAFEVSGNSSHLAT
ncbi:PHD finger protein 3 [Amphibalanus amphitrite]|uniref:PHD finger protein 3 n=1 Tax=Amphibalanus amphitrite TaxID=1232801 RepID=A0A6A4VZV7_AMPAM|nr:PHD finger protein 3 [Amphibalanus amphitrite]